MDTVKVTLELPEALVRRAEEAGVLTDARVAALLEADLERAQAGARLSEALQQLQSLEPPLTQDEIDAEIAAYRAEKRASRGAPTP